ncbi:MAG: hypothetical protein ACRDXX_17400, partial [Stackebrandtia sp.]
MSTDDEIRADFARPRALLAEIERMTDELLTSLPELEQHSRNQIEALQAVLDRGVEDPQLRQLAEELLAHHQKRLAMFAEQRQHLRQSREATAADDKTLADIL